MCITEVIEKEKKQRKTWVSENADSSAGVHIQVNFCMQKKQVQFLGVICIPDINIFWKARYQVSNLQYRSS